MNKEEILNTLNKYNFDKNEYILISSASLVVRGIKEKTKDIDISVTHKYFDYLLKNYDCKFDCMNGEAKVYFIDDVINFATTYYSDKFDDLYNIRLQTLDDVISLKKKLNRKKDIYDLKLIDNYINNNYNVLVLAYIGDSVYETYIRKYLISKGICKVKLLQEESIKYVSAKSQASFLNDIINNNMLTKDELDIVYKARNHKNNHKPKNTDIITYKYSTAFEALIGYLYYNNNIERLEEIINYITGR